MKNKLTKAKEILKKYKQEHLLYFYDDLSDKEKEILLNQILNTDFSKILNLYKNSFKNSTPVEKEKISPLPHLEKNKLSDKELKSYIKIGEDAIKSI